MKSTNLPYFSIKGEIEKSKNLYNDSSIQKENVKCKRYLTSFDKNIFNELPSNNINSHSIYGFGYFSSSTNTAFFPKELVEEVSIYGKKLYNICKKDFKIQDIPTNILQDTFIINAIYSADTKKILDVFVKWCKKYGFPIKPKEYNIIENEVKYYELPFEDIVTLSVQFIITYLLNTFYDKLLFLFHIKDSNHYNNLEESQRSALKQINNLTELFGFKIQTINEEFFDSSLQEKKKLKNFIFKNLVPVFNTYTSYFNNSTEQYYSYYQNKLYFQHVYNNIFDICWNYLSLIYNRGFEYKTKKCAMCATEIPIITDKKYCDKCAKKRKHSKATQGSKRPLIQEIVDFYNQYNIYIDNTNLEINEKVKYYHSLISEPGHSKELEGLKKEDLNNFFTKLKQKVFL